jgi:hypothetical protein
MSFTGCNVVNDDFLSPLGENEVSNASDEHTTSDESEMILSSEIRNNPEWKFANEQSKLLGMTAYEISEYADAARLMYCLLNDRSEIFSAEYNDYYVCLFSGSVWGENSYCTAISGSPAPFIDLPESERTDKQMKAMYGSSATWHDDITPYYRYLFDDGLEIRFYTDETGKKMYPDYSMVKFADQSFIETGQYSIENLMNGSDTRNGPNWEEVNICAKYLNKSADEISALLPDLIYREADEVFPYEDPNTGAKFSFNITSGKCISIELTFDMLLPMENSRAMTRQELKEYWNAAFLWTNHETYSYVYSYDDIFINLQSDRNGTVANDSLAQVGLQYERKAASQ